MHTAHSSLHAPKLHMRDAFARDAMPMATVNSSSFIFLADMHLGEGCATSATGWRANDTNCYSYRHLNATVRKANEIIQSQRKSRPVKLVLVGGDLTSSAQRTEFVAVKALLDTLSVLYLPILGNHDIWSYNEADGDLTDTPQGDSLFASVFAQNFAAITNGSSTLLYPNTTTHDPHECNCTTRYQSWAFRPSTAEYGADLEGMTFLAPDFNTRARAPPPCPGYSPVGGCGVTGKTSLHDFARGGVLPWFEARLDALRNETTKSRDGRGAHTPSIRSGSVVLLTHHPFRCRFPVPDWYFCFSGEHKAVLQHAIESRGVRDAFFGQLAGHQHRWYDGRAFDERGWERFVQWENSAVKGDEVDHEMASSLSVFDVQAARVTGATRYWQERGVWREKRQVGFGVVAR